MGNPAVLTHADGVATLTLDDADRRNPLTDRATIDSIVDALSEIERDRSVGALIVTGRGSAFSAGGDIHSMAAKIDRRKQYPHETPAYYSEGIQRIPRAFEKVSVPTIAAVNGPAIGAGCDLACMCDMRIAAQSARFGTGFVRLGLIPGDGGAWFLQRVVGYARACEMSFTGSMVDAGTALSWGLVSSVVPDTELRKEATALAGRIAHNDVGTVRMTKQLLVQAREASMDSTLSQSAALQALAHTSTAHADAVASFVDTHRR